MVEEVAPVDLSARIADNDDDTFVLDVQRQDDYEEWHVPGSENVACTAGPVSQRAAQHLHGMGYDVKTLGCTLP